MSSNTRKIQFNSKGSLDGMTMPELLVVMIVSGIVFLLLFDGLSIVQRYNRVLDRKLTEKAGLLYSHQVLETLLEKTDYIHKESNLLYFCSNDGLLAEQLEVDSTRILFRRENYTDTLFIGLTNAELYSATPESSLIDSFALSIQIGGELVKLDYGLSSTMNSMLNHR